MSSSSPPRLRIWHSPTLAAQRLEAVRKGLALSEEQREKRNNEENHYKEIREQSAEKLMENLKATLIPFWTEFVRCNELEKAAYDDIALKAGVDERDMEPEVKKLWLDIEKYREYVLIAFQNYLPYEASQDLRRTQNDAGGKPWMQIPGKGTWYRWTDFFVRRAKELGIPKGEIVQEVYRGKQSQVLDIYWVTPEEAQKKLDEMAAAAAALENDEAGPQRTLGGMV
ncbi:hypothetical protein BDV96DRAFT_646618 [Lophiotrema nucula]|uniref:Uncharacterized protein n=1 Tax=Lophiotrema nucula TaxID=690887 RepID=A0A6A5Z5L2_9PLEO|nr:hypothetical protein BDV96DRAFT_646618 [Lophiotrema nucula]